MLRTLLPALTIALLAAFVHRCCLRMADPFGDVAGLPIDEARAALFTGGPNGSAFPAALVGVFESNRRLRGATILFTEEVVGSECVGVAPNGDLLMLDRHGFVFRATPQQRKGGALAYELSKERHYVGPGRPLGFHVAGEWLYVCCSLKGLLRLHLGSGAIELLSGATGSPPSPLAYANDLDLDTSGAVYFSSSSDHPVALHPLAGFYDTMRGYLLTSLHGGMTGRLLRYDPASRRTAVLLEGISYANGVALSADGAWVAVVETNLNRVLRFWLRDADCRGGGGGGGGGACPRAGETDVLIDKLPGIPDGISRAPDGGFWLALVAPLSPLPRLLAPWPRLRTLLSHLLPWVAPFAVGSWGAVVKLDERGRPVEALYDPDGSHVATVSAATEVGGRLFLGNLGGRGVSVLQL